MTSDSDSRARLIASKSLSNAQRASQRDHRGTTVHSRIARTLAQRYEHCIVACCTCLVSSCCVVRVSCVRRSDTAFGVRSFVRWWPIARRCNIQPDSGHEDRRRRTSTTHECRTSHTWHLIDESSKASVFRILSRPFRSAELHCITVSRIESSRVCGFHRRCCIHYHLPPPFTRRLTLSTNTRRRR